MKVLFNTFYWLLIAGITGIGLLLIASLVPVSGLGVKVVKSGSMEPAIHTGGIVVIKSFSAYGVGDIITFGEDTKTQIPTTHRIVSITNAADPVYVTKGDANDTEDQSNTHLSDIRGKVLFTVPFIGFVLDFAKKPLGFFLLIGIPALAIILDELRKIVIEISSLRRKRKRKDEGGDSDPGAPSVPVSQPSSYSLLVRPSMNDIRMRTYAPLEVVEARKTHYISSIAVLFLAFAITMHIAPVGRTLSYFSDIESSIGNLFRATSVDLRIGNPMGLTDEANYPLEDESVQGEVDPQGSGLAFSFDIYGSEESASFFYTGASQILEGEPAGCGDLQLHAQFGSYMFDGPLTAFSAPATSSIGTWNFEITLPPGSSLSGGEDCEGSLIFHAQPSVIGEALGGIFSDTETFPFEVYVADAPAPLMQSASLMIEETDTPVVPAEESADEDANENTPIQTPAIEAPVIEEPPSAEAPAETPVE